MICPGCQHDNRPNRRYCGACGSNIEAACSTCGFLNDRADRFCGGCGGSMPAANALSGAAMPNDAAEAPLAPHVHQSLHVTHVAQAAYGRTPPATQPPPPRPSRITQAMPWPLDERRIAPPKVAPSAAPAAAKIDGAQGAVTPRAKP